jgi:hypothetical protein
MVKYKCIKMQCPACHVAGSAQLFLNKNGEIRYARVHHYKGLNENKKPQFEYHKVENLEALKTLLQNKETQFSTEAKASRSQGQGVGFKTHDLHLRSLSFICQNIRAGSSARIEHHPPKVEVVGSNPTPPVQNNQYSYLFSKNKLNLKISGLLRCYCKGLPAMEQDQSRRLRM